MLKVIKDDKFNTFELSTKKLKSKHKVRGLDEEFLDWVLCIDFLRCDSSSISLFHRDLKVEKN